MHVFGQADRKRVAVAVGEPVLGPHQEAVRRIPCELGRDPPFIAVGRQPPHARRFQQRQLVEVCRLLADGLQEAGLEQRQDQQVVVVVRDPERLRGAGPGVEEARMVAARHEDHVFGVRREDRLLVPRRTARQPRASVLAFAVVVHELAVEQLRRLRRPRAGRRGEGLRVEEAGSFGVGVPPLGLVPVAVVGTHDMCVGEGWRTVGCDVELGDANVPVSVSAPGDEVPVQMRILDMRSVGRPVGVVIVDALPIEGSGGRGLDVGELCLVGPVDVHRPQG